MVEEDIEAYLERSEARFAALRPDGRKMVVRPDAADRRRTPLVVVYVHGFSAGPGEVRPLPDMVARALGANLLFTRLTGHGLGPEALAMATVSDWLADFDEAMQLAAKLGDRIVIMATSTGATLVTAALDGATGRDNIAAVVFLSPNYRLKSAGAILLTLPGISWLLARMSVTRGFTPRNEAHATIWTTRYPVKALLPMAQLVQRAARAKVEDIHIPALFIHAKQDQVVDPAATARIAARWGAPHKLIDPGPGEDTDSHVIAGDALSPSTTAAIAAHMITWLRQTLTVR